MAATPRFKVFSPQGEYVASCKYIEDAAAIIAGYGDGATIREGHSKASTLWKEGAEAQPASEGYDYVAQVVSARIA